MVSHVGVGAGDFDVQRFIGRGCYSIVYEVCKKSGIDCGVQYALKRFYLENDSAVKCVLRERQILERLALADYQSPFLPVLFYGIWCNHSSAFVLREGAGCDLYDLLCHVGFLSEANARFYLSEIISGLDHLHSLDIIHLDIKPENVLLYNDGHIFVSDLDRSFDTTLNKVPTLDDFTGTPLFMAPEVAKGELIDARSDVWSLGVLIAEMVAGPIRSDSKTTAQEFQRARMGSYVIRGLKRFSKPLQSFFAACLQKDYKQRPCLADLKKLRFLKYVDWEKVASCTLIPPYKTSEIRHRPAKEDSGPIKSTDQRMLNGAFNPIKPVVFKSSRMNNKQDKEKTQEDAAPDILTESLKNDGYTLQILEEKFTSFAFIHPSLASRKVKIEDVIETKEPSTASKHADLISILSDIKLVEPRMPSTPSLFSRPRQRGLSIGD